MALTCEGRAERRAQGAPLFGPLAAVASGREEFLVGLRAEQRPTVRVHVGDDAGAVASARTALAAQADPNRPLIVIPAIPCPTDLRIVVELDPFGS